MNKKLLFLITGLMCFLSSYSQCAYTGTPLTSVGSINTFCIDNNNNTITTPSVRAGQFVLVNVVQGFRYRFLVGDVFTTDNENLTILNAADNSNVGAVGFASGASGATIADWTSTISGQIKVLLSRGACVNDNTAGGVLTLQFLGGSNTFDSQTTFGTNQWVGHVYNHVDGPPPGTENSPTSPATTTPFTAANYVGYYNVVTEAFSEDFIGNTACFPVSSNGAIRTNIYTELFSVRYRMRSTKPAGCYILNVNGDDGVRVYVDGVLVFSKWKQQGNTSYCNNLITLNGNSDIILDYYEHQGGNVLGFSLTPFDGSGNAITSPSNVSVCSNTTANIVATDFSTCSVGANGGTTAVYQWQSSADGATFTNISGANARNYTAPAVSVAPGNPNNVRYFRRVFRPSTLVAGCEFFSNVVTVTTSGDRPNGPGAISGSLSQCQTTSSIYSIAAVTNATSYTWSTTATGWTITPAANGLSVSIAFGPTATSGNLIVFASNGCAQSYSSSSVNIQVGSLPASATISGTTAVCVGAPAPAITITNPQTYGVNVTYNINGGTNNVVYVGPSSSINYITASTASTGVFVYNLVSVANGVGFSNCSTNLTGSATVTVGAVTGNQVSYGNNSWIGYVYPGTNPQNSNFSTNYVGSISQTETFDLNLDNAPISGTGICGSYADNYAVRFKMNRNLQAGCYTFTVGADDGYRLSLDGGTTWVIQDWTTHAYGEKTYDAYLSGNTNFVLEYFEAAGQARVRFASSFVSLERPTVGTRVQPNCNTPTGSVQLTGLPSGSWTLIRSGSSSLSIGGTGSETTISGLAPGTYQFAVKSGSCTSSPTGNVVIDPVTTTTYTGSTWSVSPTIDMIGVVNSNTPITANVQLCNCTVNTGINAVVSTGVSLILQDKLTVNGTLTFQNNASLIQINDVANIGNITYIRETTPIKRFDYTYWSSPVLGQKLIDVSPNTDPGSYYSFDPSTDNYFSENPQNQMKRGVGYIIRAPEGTAMPPTPLGSFIASFIGVPDNGPISVSAVVPNKPYLIGNPYPSAIDADAFLAANSKALFGTLYFWTHNTARGENVSNPGTGFYAYSADDYATYNTTGGVAVAKSDPNKAVTNPYRPTGKIAAGQSFFAGTLENMTSSTIVFNNRMRLGALNAILDNSQFFKIASKKSNTASSFEKHRLWLNLTNTQGAFKQMLVGYITDATNSYDTTYDGVSYNGNRFVDFYSVNDNKKLTIQGRALPFEENDEIPLGYSSTIEGTFSISIDQVDGLLASRKIYLEDKIKNTTHNLNQGPYTFETAKGVFNERFVLRYTDKTLGVDDVDVKSNQVLVSVKNKVIKVDSGIESIDKIYVYTVSGTAIYEKQKVDALTFSISSLPVAQQVLIVKTVLQNGNVITNKIVY
ncbi:hypothetical protein DNC80_06085 [Flavobacterium sp. SOK18b]|uniref:hypothetical protein n=1 Tax=Flavobacterium sp. SOK18b TaxID=797900 RepID=UPI0015FC9627|nr:hypothetical protein [Flavobacterium sp. SOK18b]MBB1193238.1 hypothetical protein [Flavobacterium sp. SOK18b]